MATGAQLQKAARWCAAEFKKRRMKDEHASFLASKLLEEASTRFELGDFGVEGWATSDGRTGVSYLNFGDTYAASLIVRTTAQQASFRYSPGGWGGYA